MLLSFRKMKFVVLNPKNISLFQTYRNKKILPLPLYWFCFLRPGGADEKGIGCKSRTVPLL